MAKTIKTYKGFKIKETSPRDNTTYKYQIFNSDGEFEWESDSLQECIEWIDSY